MKLVLIVLAVLTCLELLLWLPGAWRFRRQLAPVLLVGLAVVTGVMLGGYLGVAVLLLCILNVYRMINLIRLVESRIQEEYLFHASRRTAVCLICLQIAILLTAGLSRQLHINNEAWFYVLTIAQLIGIGVLAASTIRHLKTTRPPKLTSDIAERDLPPLTVAIPARNETADLEACLTSLVASNYPKLEILVLDDCSQNKRTPEIIRGFAQNGVRFIAGGVPPEQWLAKNYAYDQLSRQANGELLLFCGVDARFEPGSLKAMVATLLKKKKSMLSIIPRNLVPADHSTLSLLIQPIRYAWELSLPRKLLRRPPVLSTCWMITREALEAAGGFAAVRRKVVPESYLAKHAAAAGDGYSFLQADAVIGLACQKSATDQQETAIRTRYPQLHRRPELVALVGFSELGLLVWPLIILIISLLSQLWLLAALSAVSYITASIIYAKLVNLTYRQTMLAGWWLLPIAAIYDLGLLNYSMWQYEFKQVIWKGRNVCLPIMRVTPFLPAMPAATVNPGRVRK